MKQNKYNWNDNLLLFDQLLVIKQNHNISPYAHVS